MHVITDERCLAYSQPGHPERPQRVAGTRALLREQREIKITWEKPVIVNDDDILRAHELTQNLPVANLNSGTSASSTTFWRGDGTWAIAGTGDVVGPGSSTDNALAKFDSTTGKVIQNSNATLSDAGTLTATAFAGALTGNVTGNASGTAATVTGGTQASITSTANLVTVGTIGTGTWQGTAIADAYVANDLTISGGTVNNSVIGGSTPAAATVTTLNATGATTLDGAVTLGNATGDDIVMTGRMASHMVPKTTNTYDLGTSSLRYRELFLSGSTINLGGATISSDGTGTISIAATGAILPVGSLVGTQKIAQTNAAGVSTRNVEFFTNSGGLGTAAKTFVFKGSGTGDLVFTTFTFNNGNAITTQTRSLFVF